MNAMVFCLTLFLTINAFDGENVVYVDNGTTIECDGNSRRLTRSAGQNVRTVTGAYVPINQNFSSVSDPNSEWNLEPLQTQWIISAASDWPWFEINNENRTSSIELKYSGTALQLVLSDGLDYDGSLLYLSAFDPNTSMIPTVSSNAICYNVTSGFDISLIQAVENFQLNCCIDGYALASIPSPTEAFSDVGYSFPSDYSADNFRIAIVFDVLNPSWGDLDMQVNGANIPDGSVVIMDKLDFTYNGSIIMASILPGMAYKNVDVSDDRVLFWARQENGFVPESDFEIINYTIDRLNDRFIISVPYKLFLDADTVFIDPTYTSSQPDDDDRSALVYSTDTDMQSRGYYGGISWRAWSVYDYSLFCPGCISDGTLDGLDITSFTIYLYRYDGANNNDTARLRAFSTGYEFLEIPYSSPYYQNPATNYTTYSHAKYTATSWAGNEIINELSSWYQDFTIPNNTCDLELELDSDGIDEVLAMIADSQADGFTTDSRTFSETHYHRFYSENAALQADRPKFVVEYTVSEEEEENIIPFERDDVSIFTGSLGVSVVFGVTPSMYINSTTDLKNCIDVIVYNYDENIDSGTTYQKITTLGVVDGTHCWDKAVLAWTGKAGGDDAQLSGMVYCSTIEYVSGTHLGVIVNCNMEIDTIDPVSYAYTYTYGDEWTNAKIDDVTAYIENNTNAMIASVSVAVNDATNDIVARVELVSDVVEMQYSESMLQGATQSTILAYVSDIYASIGQQQYINSGENFIAQMTDDSTGAVFIPSKGIYRVSDDIRIRVQFQSDDESAAPKMILALANSSGGAVAYANTLDASADVGWTTSTQTWSDASAHAITRLVYEYKVQSSDLSSATDQWDIRLSAYLPDGNLYNTENNIIVLDQMALGYEDASGMNDVVNNALVDLAYNLRLNGMVNAWSLTAAEDINGQLYGTTREVGYFYIPEKRTAATIIGVYDPDDGSFDLSHWIAYGWVYPATETAIQDMVTYEYGEWDHLDNGYTYRCYPDRICEFTGQATSVVLVGYDTLPEE